jgi:TQXA domain-containing protein
MPPCFPSSSPSLSGLDPRIIRFATQLAVWYFDTSDTSTPDRIGLIQCDGLYRA